MMCEFVGRRVWLSLVTTEFLVAQRAFCLSSDISLCPICQCPFPLEAPGLGCRLLSAHISVLHPYRQNQKDCFFSKQTITDS